MLPIARTLRFVLIAAGTAFATLPALAGSVPPALPFYPFVGNWHGKGELAEPGRAPAGLDVSLSCQEASGGWAVTCRMQAKNASMTIEETDLMGVDPVTGKGHWYAVSNQGETHDHEAAWTDSKIMMAHYTWQQEGQQMQEDIMFDFSEKDRAHFRSTTRANGKAVGEFSGTVVR
jgi:hypothetical protein